MQFHPILFSTEMVRSILKKIKRLTRRTTGLHPVNAFPDMWQPEGNLYVDKNGKLYQKFRCNNECKDWVECAFPYGKVGDVLWVRENFAYAGMKIRYKADGDWRQDEIQDGEHSPWKPSIHMPKTACRIFMQIKSIRVERLQDISEEDAVAEGIEQSMSGNGRIVYKHYLKDKYGPSPVHSFETLWRKINSAESWNANPWVWVIEFEQISKPQNFN